VAALGGVASQARREIRRARNNERTPGEASRAGEAGWEAQPTGALRRRRATQHGAANPPSPLGCGGRPPSPASLLLDVPQGARLRRRSLHPAAWRTQRGSREVVKGALRGVSRCFIEP